MLVVGFGCEVSRHADAERRKKIRKLRKIERMLFIVFLAVTLRTQWAPRVKSILMTDLRQRNV